MIEELQAMIENPSDLVVGAQESDEAKEAELRKSWGQLAQGASNNGKVTPFLVGLTSSMAEDAANVAIVNKINFEFIHLTAKQILSAMREVQQRETEPLRTNPTIMFVLHADKHKPAEELAAMPLSTAPPGEELVALRNGANELSPYMLAVKYADLLGYMPAEFVKSVKDSLKLQEREKGPIAVDTLRFYVESFKIKESGLHSAPVPGLDKKPRSLVFDLASAAAYTTALQKASIDEDDGGMKRGPGHGLPGPGLGAGSSS